MEDKKLFSNRLGINEDDVKAQYDLPRLFNWKHETKKQINRMQDKLEITKEKGGDDNPSMKRAIRCQKLFLEIIEDQIDIIKHE